MCRSIGVTRLNVYGGLAGFYLLRTFGLTKPELARLPWPPPGADPAARTSTQLRELPLAIQDRAFTSDGQLYYPVNTLPRSAVLPNTPYHPFWVPGGAMLGLIKRCCGCCQQTSRS